MLGGEKQDTLDNNTLTDIHMWGESQQKKTEECGEPEHECLQAKSSKGRNVINIKWIFIYLILLSTVVYKLL